jgi:hypothetical protein
MAGTISFSCAQNIPSAPRPRAASVGLRAPPLSRSTDTTPLAGSSAGPTGVLQQGGGDGSTHGAAGTRRRAGGVAPPGWTVNEIPSATSVVPDRRIILARLILAPRDSIGSPFFSFLVSHRPPPHRATAEASSLCGGGWWCSAAREAGGGRGRGDEFLYVLDASAAVADRRRCRARLPTGPPAAASEVRGFTLTVPRHLSFRRWSMTRT